ncbi:MAG: PAS domain S-box protein [Anaerolineae bacterium]|nr:PAS domain S-box protein [Anaerolineae bacterium]
MGSESVPKDRTPNELAELRRRLAEAERRLDELASSEASCKMAEEALRCSEERYALAQRVANIGSWDWDILTGDLHWSDQIEPLFGFEQGGFSATYEGFLQCVHPEDRQYVVDSVAACVNEDKDYDIEHRIVWPDGTVRWVSETGDVIRGKGGKAIRMLGIVQDITERKQADEALSRERDLVRHIMDTSPVGITLMDRRGQITFANARAEQVLGLAREGIGRRTYNDPGWHITDYDGNPFPDEELPFQRVMTTGRPVFDVRHAVEYPDGRRVLLSINTAPLFGEAGQVDVMVSTVEDVTEREQANEALRRYAAELEARNEELDAFAHTAAHDLKNPLGLVIGFAEVLKMDYAVMSPEELEKYARAISQNGRRMNRIIDELLLLAGVRQAEAKVEPLDMSGVVVEVQQRLVDVIEEHQAEIVLPESWPTALGYGPWVEEVWVNYLDNAIKYGGRPPRVELGAEILPLSIPPAEGEGKGEMVRFWVRDNGQGLTAEEKERLFSPFTRLDQVRIKGHGLGLSLVRRIVEKLDGQVGVESEEGKGSIFSFTLPGPEAG